MKITIEPTEHRDEYPSPTIIISHPSDDIDCEEAVQIVLNALVVWGYNYESVFEERAAIVELEAQVKKLNNELSGYRTKKQK